VRLIDALARRSALPEPETVAMLSQSWIGQEYERINQTYRSYIINGNAANSIVYSCSLQRLQLLAQAEFKWQDLTTRRLFGNPDLSILENPWPNGTTTDLIARLEQHVTAAGNAFVRKAGDSLVVMRPDWIDILSVVIPEGYDDRGAPKTHEEVLGYLYSNGGIGVGEPVFFDVEEVAHWAPIPDPLSRWRGMSWLTPVLREINADVAMTQHRQQFFDQAGTPNLVLKYQQKITPQTLNSIRERWQARYAGPTSAGATVVLDEGADLVVVGASFESMRFNDLQAAGEARIAAAAGVPASVAGIQSGQDPSHSNYQIAIKAMANGTGAYLWRSMCAALAKLVIAPVGGRLWYDTSAIPALREDDHDRAANMQVMAAAASTLLTAGYESDSILAALVSGDLTQLKHTGLVSVQLYKAAAKDDAALHINKIPVDDDPIPSPPKLPSA
jgi:phage portal protein BeeE